MFVPERCGLGSLTSKGTVNVASPLIIAFAIRCCNVIVLMYFDVVNCHLLEFKGFGCCSMESFDVNLELR